MNKVWLSFFLFFGESSVFTGSRVRLLAVKAEAINKILQSPCKMKIIMYLPQKLMELVVRFEWNDPCNLLSVVQSKFSRNLGYYYTFLRPYKAHSMKELISHFVWRNRYFVKLSEIYKVTANELSLSHIKIIYFNYNFIFNALHSC